MTLIVLVRILMMFMIIILVIYSFIFRYGQRNFKLKERFLKRKKRPLHPPHPFPPFSLYPSFSLPLLYLIITYANFFHQVIIQTIESLKQINSSITRLSTGFYINTTRLLNHLAPFRHLILSEIPFIDHRVLYYSNDGTKPFITE